MYGCIGKYSSYTPIFLQCIGVIYIKDKTFEEMIEFYGADKIIKICNIKQMLAYAKMKCQPIWIDEGYNGKLIAYYYQPETIDAWNYWKKTKK